MNRQSILTKLASKQVLMPLELVKIQYLDRKHLGESCPNIAKWPNPYLAVENIPSLMSTEELRKVLYISEPKKQRAYEYYQWLANYLINLDNASAEVGYRGVALINELRYCQTKQAVQLLLHEEESDVEISFEASYKSLIESFGRTFRDLIIITDNVLTANLDLEEMVDISELKCLQYLHRWFEEETKPTEDKAVTQINIADVCYKNTLSTILNQNHPEFVELLKSKAQEKGYELFPNFAEDSMIYVRGIIEEELKIK